MREPLPGRKCLPHVPPDWVDIEGQVFFLTLCCQPRGRSQLANTRTWGVVLDTFLTYEELRYWFVRRVLAMPDHLHALVSFPREMFMRKRIAAFKAWTAKQAGISWQREFFDHRVRHDESLEGKSLYIAMNPVRAGLCEKPEDWPYSWKR